MASFPSVYRAQAVHIKEGPVLDAFVPQVFGETPILINTYVGGPPTEPGLGWVMFQGGNPEFPVWMGVAVVVDEGDGDGGGGTDMGTYVHNQGAPSSVWTIVHNLGGFPNVTVEDSAGDTIEGEITFDNANQLTLTFSAAFSGIAYLS